MPFGGVEAFSRMERGRESSWYAAGSAALRGTNSCSQIDEGKLHANGSIDVEVLD